MLLQHFKWDAQKYPHLYFSRESQPHVTNLCGSYREFVDVLAEIKCNFESKFSDVNENRETFNFNKKISSR